VTERVYLSPPHLFGRERELVAEAFDSNWVAPLGPHVDSFEREVAEVVGRRYATALSSGTAALHLALRILGVGPGDEVLTSTLTFSATANAIAYERASPVLIDATDETWNLDPNLVEEELERLARVGKLPKAVIAVDLYGQCADYDRIVSACDRWEVPLVEDAAESLGATYRGRPAGSFGVMAAFSFNGNKIITTSSGGLLASDDERWTTKARFLATQARDPAPHYQHSEIGFNYRMSNILAAIGRGQLESLAERVETRRTHFDAGPCRPSRNRVHAGGSLRALYPLADLLDDRPERVRGHTGGRPAGPGRKEHRGTAGVETDAPPAGLLGMPLRRRTRVRAIVRQRPVSAEWFEPGQGRP